MSNTTVEVRDLREQDWLWTSTAVLFHSKINGNTYKVYCGLSSYANNQTQKAFPSIATLAKKLHMGRSTVMRALSILESLGAVKVEKTLGEHNIYFLLKVIDDTPKKPKTEIPVDEQADWVKKMLEWAEKRRGTKYVVYGKQIGSLGLMKKAGYTPREIAECFLLLEKDEYWKSRGFDFTNIANELPKKIISIRDKYGNKSFEHLTKR